MIKYLLISLCAVFALASCTVYEDYTFAKDGSVKYKMTVDMSEMVKQTGKSPTDGKKQDEKSFNLSKLLTDSLPPQLQDKYKDFITAVKPFYFELEDDQNKQENLIYISADFKNADDLNTGLQALQNMGTISSQLTKDIRHYEQEEQGIDPAEVEETPEELPFKMGAPSNLTWQDKKMSQVFIKDQVVTEEVEDEAEADNEEDESIIGKAVNRTMEEMMNQMLGFGKYTVRYHFPTEIKSYSKTEGATLSADKKTLEYSYGGIHFLSNADRDVEVETK